jgi:precorrin-6Y C5,15-methyltransferase (decarboxylating)
VRLTVVGIGADGWAGLGEPARAALQAASTIVGSERQLALLPDDLAAERSAWPSPIDPLLDALVAQPDGTAVLASGDPMLHGIGATLARRLSPDQLTIHPHPSAFALACARLGWPAAEVELVSAVARPPETIVSVLQPGRRIVAYVTGKQGAAEIARVLRDRGYGPSRLVVLEQLGGPDERIHDSTADDWGDMPADPLHAVAIEARPAAGTPLLPPTPGRPDDAYEHDGQLTKRATRAIALAALAPAPGQLLWDVGAGAGSIGIEWLRAEPTARAIAIEADAERAQRIERNARSLGVLHLQVHHGRAPQALDDLDEQPPDAIFVGGGTAEPGLIDRCYEALNPGGRLVAHAVTIEGEQALQQAQARHGGRLLRIELSHAEPLGSFTGWQPVRPVVQWAVTK